MKKLKKTLLGLRQFVCNQMGKTVRQAAVQM